MRIDITPLLPELETKLAAVWQPPFRIYEPFVALGAMGEVILAAEPAATEEEYQEALTATLQYFDEKYNLVRMADDAMKWKGVLAPVEFVDGQAVSYILYHVAIPQLAKQLAEHIG